VRREAGEEERMKEPYGEGLAIHTDPESCVCVREGTGEALTGAHMGWVLSRERPSFEVPTLWAYGEGNTGGRASASARTASRGRRPHARMEPPRTETGRSPVWPSAVGAGGPHREGPKGRSR
jgi:hypothetical protein